MYHISFGVYHIFFIHPSVDAHLGCFHVLAIVNNAACTFSNYCFLQLYVFFGGLSQDKLFTVRHRPQYLLYFKSDLGPA